MLIEKRVVSTGEQVHWAGWKRMGNNGDRDLDCS